MPGIMDAGSFPPSPSSLARPVAAATAVRCAGVPFAKRNFEFADREGMSDRDAMLGLRGLVRGRRTHRELAGRDHDHLGAVRALLELRESPRHPPDSGRRGHPLFLTKTPVTHSCLS